VPLTRYYWGDQIKEDRVKAACGRSGGEEKCIEALVGRPEGKRLLTRPRRRWEYNIKINLKELEWEDVDHVHLIGMETCVRLL
jgi:hypothetical protein